MEQKNRARISQLEGEAKEKEEGREKKQITWKSVNKPLNIFAAALTFARAALCSDRVTFMVMMLLMTLPVTLCLDVLMQVVRLLMLWLMLW